ncbi:MAG: gluconate 2-dehydrogenase subunit 3 family protein [Gemmatimonadota bacterium]|jgi:gluconate 2-dehydrogenase gamma chain
MTRRSALKVIAAAAAAPTVVGCEPGSQEAPPPDATAQPGNPLATGTAWDPDLVAPVVPWERTLTDRELATLAVLCDVIIPADDRSPAASAVGAQDFIDEWVSAPYPGMRRDKVLIRGGLVWLDAESSRRFGEGRAFGDLTDEERRGICDDICYLPEAAEDRKTAARFFAKVRDLTATAFYTTREGMDDLGYVGNSPLARWDAPPPDALRHVGLD